MSELNFSAMSHPPRGILKNRESRFSSVPDSTASLHDPRLQSSMSINTGNLNVGGSESSWMTGAPGGINPIAPPGSRSGIGLEGGPKDAGLDQSLCLKVNDFVARKRDVIFKPLEKDELPIPEVHGVGKSSEDHYGLVPSLDHYLRADETEIRRYFFQNTKVGDIFVATVSSKNQSGLFLRLIATEGKRHIVLEDLGVKVFCPSNQLVPARDRSYEYENGTYVRVEALEVNADGEKLICGMKGITLTTEQQHSYTLGAISERDLPRQYLLAKAEGESRRRDYEEALTSSLGFKNPNNIQHLATTMGLISGHNNTSTILKGLRGSFPSKEMAVNLRRVQNAKWAHENVAHGIKYFKAGKFTEAFQCLNKALSIDAENVEGLVARGALYANKGSFEKAIEDFESALKFNPNHFNARKYLAETLVALGKQQEEGLKLEDAVASYSKCLVIKSDHKEAKDALWSLYERTNKLDVSKLAPVAASKASELKEKLKAILQTELGMRIEAKNGGKEKEKKSKKKKSRKSSGSDDDSSSSSSSSDSDSSSSEDSRSRKKKKSKKKKKKSKKSRSKSNRDESKARAPSLSPFSKRLVDPQGAAASGLAGFSQSTYEEWGQQLGLPSKPEKKDESEEEPKKKKDKKRSKKKDKRKKRKRTSSSSSSSDSDDSRSKDRKKSKSGTADTSINNRSSIEGILPDLGDLEAKLSAYYSKIEQVRMDPAIPPEAVKITVDRSSSSLHPRDAYNEPVRKIEVKPNSDDERERDRSRHHNIDGMSSSGGNWHEPKFPSKIEIRTDEYGNFLHSENIVRTVHNDSTPAPEVDAGPKPIKFEMKFKTAAHPVQASSAETASGGDTGGMKWRPLGTAPPKDDDEDDEKEPSKPAIRNPFEVQKYDRDSSGRMGRDQDRNYRGRKSFRSRSPSAGRRRPRRSRSNSRSRSSSNSSRSRSRSRSPNYRIRRNPRDRYDGRDRRDFGGREHFRGRGGARFFRGYNRGGRRPYLPQRGRTYRPNGPSKSKFRNRFSRSPTGSASRSRSRSRSRPRRSTSRGAAISRSRSRSPGIEKRDSRDKDRKDRGNPKSPRKDSTTPVKKVTDDPNTSTTHSAEDTTVVTDNEIQIGTLTTTRASEVEELLDKRNAEKKEELRKSNPDFFRSN